MNIAIVEDERSATDILHQMLEKFAQERNESLVIYEFSDAVTFLEKYKPDYDIVFMDIKLPKMNGMEAAKKLREKDTNVILYFITRMAQYAIKGYEVGALDFILKPVTYAQLKMKLERALVELKRNQTEKVVINHKMGTAHIATRDIYYIEILGHHLIYHTVFGDYEAYGTLKVISNSIKDPLFVQCNRCYVVNLRHVREIRNQNVIVEKYTLQISRARKSLFLKSVNEYLGGKM